MSTNFKNQLYGDTKNLTYAEFFDWLWGDGPDDAYNFGEETEVRVTYNPSFSLEIQVAEQLNQSFGDEIQVLEYFAPATSDPANLSNAFQPSVYVDGATVYENPATAVIPSPKGVDINLNWGGILTDCDVIQASVNLTIGSGTFSILAKNDIASLGSFVNICGLQGLVTYHACISGHAAKGYKIEGIFGDQRALNQQVLLLAQLPGMSGYRSAFHQIFLQQAPTNQWGTVADCARAIANAAQLGISWSAPDTHLIDAFLETGLTVGDALRSLASRVGGMLLWDGATGWVATTPDVGYGGWGGVPCALVNGGGIESGDILDLVGSILYFPVNANVGNALFLERSPILFPPDPPVLPKTTFRTALNASAPPHYIHLDGDHKLTDGITPVVDSTHGLRYQIVLGNGHPAVSDPGVVPLILDDTPGSPTFGQLVNDTDHWVPLSAPITKSKDGQYKASITNTNFPPGLINNRFNLNIGYIRDVAAINAANAQAFQEFRQRKILAEQAQLERIRYFKVGQGSLSFNFFGSVGLPGNKTTITYDGCSLTGIIESFSFSYPQKTAQVTVGRYVKIIGDTARSKLDFFTATGGG